MLKQLLNKLRARICAGSLPARLTEPHRIAGVKAILEDEVSLAEEVRYALLDKGSYTLCAERAIHDTKEAFCNQFYDAIWHNSWILAIEEHFKCQAILKEGESSTFILIRKEEECL